MSRIAFDALPLTVCVIGSRGFPRRDWVEGFARRLRPGTLLVHGGNPDTPEVWAEWIVRDAIFRSRSHIRLTDADRWADAPYPIPQFFRADWKPQGRRELTDSAAGPRRNRTMLEYVASRGGVLIAFDHPNEKVGEFTIDLPEAMRHADTLHIPTYLIRLDGDGQARGEIDRFAGYLIDNPAKSATKG